MSSDDIRHFLVVYDVAARHATVREFGDYEEALAAYDELEKEFLKPNASDAFDIVLLGADSLETIKRTHSSYFETTEHGFERFFRDALVG
jgi:hypothetical protein